MKTKDYKMTELEEKNDIMIDILELNDDAQDILQALFDIATLDQFYELYNSFYEPPEERSDYDEHNTMHKNFH
jgi:trans-2-enoyl-CoA reductase